MAMSRSELCAWLRANSSGIYRPAANAADDIEALAKEAARHFEQAMMNGEAAMVALAEADVLRKDAERYRWLRRRQVECAPHIAIAEKAAERFDSAIDRAMAAASAVGAA